MGTEERLLHFRSIELEKLSEGIKELEEQDSEVTRINMELNGQREKIEHKVNVLFDKNGNIRKR